MFRLQEAGFVLLMVTDIGISHMHAFVMISNVPAVMILESCVPLNSSDLIRVLCIAQNFFVFLHLIICCSMRC